MLLIELALPFTDVIVAVVLVAFGMPRITNQGTLRFAAPLLTFVTVTNPLFPICTGSKVDPGPI